jgi:transposase
MKRYIGCDVHATSCTFGVLGPSGRRLHSEVVETNGRALIEFIRRVPGDRHICLEEGEQAQWIVELLGPHAKEIVVVQPPRRLSVKNDEQDAFEVAEILRTGQACRRVFKDPFCFQSIREAARAYTMFNNDVVRIKNRIKAFYRGRGAPARGQGPYTRGQRDRYLQGLPRATRTALELLYEELDHADDLRRKARSVLLRESHQHSISRVLETAPGLGPLRVAQLLPIVVTPHRFRTRQQFWAYCGFAVVTRSSSDWVRRDTNWVRSQVTQTRGLNHNRNPRLKEIFKGAAIQVCTRSTRQPLHEDYQKLLEKGVKPNLARVTIARRIAAIVLAMWKHAQPYDPHYQSASGSSS